MIPPEDRLDVVPERLSPEDEDAGVEEGVEEGQEVGDGEERVPHPQLPVVRLRQFEHEEGDGVRRVADEEDEGQLEDGVGYLEVPGASFANHLVVGERGYLHSAAYDRDGGGEEEGDPRTYHEDACGVLGDQSRDDPVEDLTAGVRGHQEQVGLEIHGEAVIARPEEGPYLERNDEDPNGGVDNDGGDHRCSVDLPQGHDDVDGPDEDEKGAVEDGDVSGNGRQEEGDGDENGCDLFQFFGV